MSDDDEDTTSSEIADREGCSGKENSLIPGIGMCIDADDDGGG